MGQIDKKDEKFDEQTPNLLPLEDMSSAKKGTHFI
jgi:hypothetical protein